MLINFISPPEEICSGIKHIESVLDFKRSSNGISLYVNKGNETRIISDGKKGNITYKTKNEFFRALGFFIEKKAEKINIHINCQFEKTGVMLDVSRGGVINVDSAKHYMDYMASLGLNMLMLYTEDTYDVPKYEYFGYMRGKYTKDELKELDDYAYDYGIEMIPCIQTYSHMEQYLKWGEASSIRDTSRTLLADADETYEFLDAIIKNACAPFRSNRIHIGLDESQDMLRGNYIDRFGYNADTSSVFFRHMNKVCDIAKKYEHIPMMWSDMPFRILSDNGNSYYDAKIELKNFEKFIPKEIELVYWNYDGNTEQDRSMLKKHISTNRKTLFAGRIHTSGPMVNNKYSIKTIDESLKAAKSEKIRECFVTFWGNDGCEANYFHGLPALTAWAENCYHIKNVSISHIKERFEFITGGIFDAFILMSYFQNNLDDKSRPLSNYVEISQGKRILWQDILLGVMDNYLYNYPLSDHYKNCALKMSKYDTLGKWSDDYKFTTVLFNIMYIKSYLAENLKHAYETHDVDFLKDCVNNKLPYLLDLEKEFHKLYEKQWFSYKKPHGYEVIDSRLASIETRCESCRKRLEDFLSGKISRIEELDEKRLPFPPYSYNYNEIATVYKP